MKKYKVIVSETAEQDLENIILYLKNDLAGEIIADKYKILFKQNLKLLEDVAESMLVLDEKLTGHKDIRKLNVKNYIIFYKIDKQNNITYVVRIGHSFMDWEKYLKDV
ncbi:MAG: type II toxin-antitoxin system RelE/ParE family toxin [Candidatus Scatovivens sp.]